VPGHLRLRQYLHHPLDQERNPGGNLLQLIDSAGRVEKFKKKYGDRKK
jgi:hypothetical protein